MTSVFPPVPRFIFTVLEPLSCIAGWLGPTLNAQYFVAEQIPQSSAQALTPNAHVVALQLGNVYLLLALIGFAVLYSTTEARVVRNYIIALWLGDIGHLAVTYHVLGYSRFVDFANYNAMAWGNIGATVFLFLARTMYLLGLFGPDLPATPSSGKKEL